MNQNKDSQQQQQNLLILATKADAKGLFASIKILVELLDFRHDTDREATISAIKADISFKGAKHGFLFAQFLLPLLDLSKLYCRCHWCDAYFAAYGAHSWCWYVYAINDIDTLRKCS